MNASPGQVPFDGDEVAMLRARLDHNRGVLRGKADGLDDEQLRRTLAPSSLTLGGLLKHLAMVEDYWFGVVWRGEHAVEPWASADWKADPDWEFTSSRDDDGATLRRLFDDSVAASNRILEHSLAEGAGVLDRFAVRQRHGSAVSLRWILTHLIEEYARHNGHADLIRESIDGVVGS